MKRGAPMKRGKPLRRKTWMRSRKGSTSYSRRDRDFDFMGWVRRQPCIVRELAPGLFIQVTLVGTELGAVTVRPKVATPCSGRIEADHAGARGLSQKADDSTCIPLCSDHHAERTDHRGSFRNLTRDEARAWRSSAIEHTQAAWTAWSKAQ